MLRGLYKIFFVIILVPGLLFEVGKYRYSKVYIPTGKEVGPALDYFISFRDTAVVRGKECFITNDKALSFDFDRVVGIFRKVVEKGGNVLILYEKENDLLKKYMSLLVLKGVPGNFLKYSDLGVSELLKCDRVYIFLPGMDFAFGEDLQVLVKVLNACSFRGSSLWVIDFPNLFSGEKIAVPFCRIKVFDFELPYMYGMTLGELALMLNEVYLKKPVDLRIIAVSNYNRKLWYDELGLRWYLDYYDIATMKDALMCAAREIFRCSNLEIDENYVIKAEWLNNREFIEKLNRQRMKGVKFERVKSHDIEGVGICITDRSDFNPVLVCCQTLSLASRMYPHRFRMENEIGEKGMFDFNVKVYVESGYDFDKFEKLLSGRLNRFLSLRSRYLIYR